MRQLTWHVFSMVLVAIAGLLTQGAFTRAPAFARDEASSVVADRIVRVDEYLDRLASIGFRGAILIAQDGEVLVERGYGWTDDTRTTPIGPGTIFAIGSNTKPFTAAAILKLQDQGKLRVGATIATYLPDVPADKRGITVHQLLTHSAGFDHSGIFEGDFEQVSRDEAVRRILASELLFPPGSESSYADASMILLAAIVEHVSGQPYESFVRDELFAPAGMVNTGHRDDPTLRGSAQAVGIVAGEPTGAPADLPPVSWAIKGAGGLASTVADLYRWHQAVVAGRILSPVAQEAYRAAHVPISPDAAEGYGWVIAEPMPGHRLRASAGGTEEIGHVNVIDWWLNDDLLIIGSSADASYNIEEIVPAIERILFGLPQELPPRMTEVDPAVLRDYAGRYELPSGGAIVVTATKDRLNLSPDGEAAFDLLLPRGETEVDEDTARAEATLAYLESGKEEGLDAWLVEQESTLGPFRRMTVVGTAPHEGSGEAWTYVAFEFARGSTLTRWIVEEHGVLAAAVVPSDPPRAMFLPASPTAFSSFALGNPETATAVFLETEAGAWTLQLTSSAGDTVQATRR